MVMMPVIEAITLASSACDARVRKAPAAGGGVVARGQWSRRPTEKKPWLPRVVGGDLRPIPLIDRRLQLTELVARSSVPCLHLVWGFDNGAKLLEAAEQHGLEGIISKRQASAYRSGPSRDGAR